MPVRQLICCAALASVVAAAPRTPVERFTVAAPPAAAATDTITRYYTLTIRFRPFLLWMTRDDVGGARISWSPSAGPDTRVELLVGSDPQRAPMSINRWGFISEQKQGDTALLTGIMTETDEEAIDGARSNVASIENGRAFRGIRSTVRNGDAATSFGRLMAERDVTYHQYEALLARFLAAPANATQHVRLAPGVEPGFLTTLRALVGDSVDLWQRSRRLAPNGARRDYLYAGKLYNLSVQSTTLVNDAVVGGRALGSAVDGRFQIRNVLTGGTTDFSMLYGVTGSNAGTPLRLVYRPRWWIELQLDIVR